MSAMWSYGMQTENCLTSDVVEKITKSFTYCIVDGTSETIDYDVLKDVIPKRSHFSELNMMIL